MVLKRTRERGMRREREREWSEKRERTRDTKKERNKERGGGRKRAIREIGRKRARGERVRESAK